MRAPDPRAPRWLRSAVFGDRPADDGHLRAQHRATCGVMAAVLALLVLGGLRAVATPPFAPPDETAHVAYALAVADWEIPHVANFPDDLPIPGMPEGLSIWTANHPPGTYALMAVPLTVGTALDRPLAGLWSARLLNLAAVAIGVVLSARIAATLLPRRPRVVVTTAVVTALLPYYLQVAGTAYTDGLALAPQVALLAVAIDVLVRGPSRRRLGWLLLLSAAAALVRAPAVVLVLLAGIAWGVAQLLHADASVPARLRNAVGGAALIGLAAFAAAGWFYLGNIALYGDPTGSQALFELHGRQPRDGSVWFRLTAPGTYTFHLLQLWARIEGLPGRLPYAMSSEMIAPLSRMTAVGLLLGVGTAVWHGARTRLRGAAPQVAAIVLLAVWWGALLVMMAHFVTGGGAPHARYLWPALTGPALLLAVGVDVLRLPLPGSVRDLPIGHWVTAGTVLWADAFTGLHVLWRWELVAQATPPLEAVVQALAARGLPAPTALTATALTMLAAAVAGVAVSLWTTPARLPVSSGDAAEPRQPPAAAGSPPAEPRHPATSR